MIVLFGVRYYIYKSFKMDLNMILEDLNILETSRRSDRPRHRVNSFELNDEEFKYKYRFTKRFNVKLVDLLREDLAHVPKGSLLSPEYASLVLYATGLVMK